MNVPPLEAVPKNLIFPRVAAGAKVGWIALLRGVVVDPDYGSSMNQKRNGSHSEIMYHEMVGNGPFGELA